MILEIPVPTGPFTTMTIDLDGQTYRLNFRWNTRESAWYLDIAEVDDTPIAMGIKVVPNLDISSKFKAYGSPEGILLTLGESVKAERPGRDEFGDRVRLYYLDSDEVTAIESETATIASSFVIEEIVTVTPVPVKGYVESDGVSTTILFNEAMESLSATPSLGVAINVNASPVAFTGAAIAYNVLSLTLSTPVISTDVVTFSYTKATGDLQSTSQTVSLEDVTDFAITNLVP